MIEDDFDIRDLYGLEACLRDLNEMIARFGNQSDDKAVRYALIKTFELTYEMSIKALRSYLVFRSLDGVKASVFEFRDLIRLGDQVGLLHSGWPEWKRFRDDRSRTVHTYGGEVALDISAHLDQFSKEAQFLINRLKERVSGEDAC